MSADRSSRFLWSRREWLGRTSVAAGAAVASPFGGARSGAHARLPMRVAQRGGAAAQAKEQAGTADFDAMRELARRAADAATAAGATYADARLTRTVEHEHTFGPGTGFFLDGLELKGLGVRAQVGGYWGFAAGPLWTADEATRLAREAVAQARENAKGPARPAELAPVSVATGHWSTPVRIDPFTISLEEKGDAIGEWSALLNSESQNYMFFELAARLRFWRQERALATSAGTLVTQTLYRSGGRIETGVRGVPDVFVEGIATSAKGWELFFDADIPGQIAMFREEYARRRALLARAVPVTIGKYTLVCDGATMAAVLDATLGLATQLDRALGYEANAGGTSFLDDPFAMVGTQKVASPLVTVTANRSAPGQLATVKWDDEGVEPEDFTLVKGGFLTDFQTTREQAAWLKEYYGKAGKPVRSHGCAASEDALALSMQHTPNLAMVANAADVRVDDLAASVKDGLLVTLGPAGWVQADFQGKNGMIFPETMRRIKNGRLGPTVSGGAILFSTDEFMKNIIAIGGASTQVTTPAWEPETMWRSLPIAMKGQPSQVTNHSVSAPAAMVEAQSLIDPSRR